MKNCQQTGQWSSIDYECKLLGGAEYNMIITHKIGWDKCLSHNIWPAIEKGWQDKDDEVHFFWGLAGKNVDKIRECIRFNKEWWYVDVGYLNVPFTRYPDIQRLIGIELTLEYVKGNLHTIRGAVGDGTRLSKLESEGIDCQFKGWQTVK